MRAYPRLLQRHRHIHKYLQGDLGAVDYVNNGELERLIFEYQQLLKTPGEALRRCEDDLARVFYMVAGGLLKKYSFTNVDYDDALQEAVMVCMKKARYFDPNFKKDGTKTKAFNYLTTIMLNHFRQLYRIEYNAIDKIIKYARFLADNPDKSLEDISSGRNQIHDFDIRNTGRRKGRR